MERAYQKMCPFLTGMGKYAILAESRKPLGPRKTGEVLRKAIEHDQPLQNKSFGVVISCLANIGQSIDAIFGT